MQTCNTCFIEKPFSEYYKFPRNKSGYQYQCKLCRKEYCSKLWTENKDVMYARNKKWAQANPQKLYEYQKKKSKKYLNDLHNKWVTKNREHLRDYYHKRRATAKNNGVYKILPKHLKKLYVSPCLYCGSTDRITADHVIPITKGGTHSIGNLVPACLSCNSSKGNHFITEWKQRKR